MSEEAMETEINEETEVLEESALGAHGKIMVPDSDKSLTHFVQRMKLAVALAVIRSTPSGMTPGEYAAHLGYCFIEDVSKWKNKYEDVKRELITLEQKLQIRTMKEKFNIPNMDLMVTDGLSPLQYQPCIESSDLRSKISDTVEFVRSFIFIGSLSHDMEESNLEINGRMRETVLQSTSLMLEHLRSDQGLLLEFEIVKCAIKEVHRLYDARANYFEKDLTDICLKFVDNLLLDVYRTLEINMVEFQHRRSALIQMLAEHSKLSVPILCRLLKEINVYSKSFQTMFDAKIEDFTPLLRIENVYFILQTTEGTLYILRQQKSSLNIHKIPKALLVEWNKSAENSLLEIGTRFSMYSIYVWNVKTLLQSVFDMDYCV